jgi:hypothetical protein
VKIGEDFNINGKGLELMNIYIIDLNTFGSNVVMTLKYGF